MAVTPLGIAAGILISAVSGGLVQLIRRRFHRQQTAEEWYQEALGLVSRAERTGHRTTEYQQETATETLRSELDPLSEELKEHAASAPSEIPQGARDRLNFLADITTALVIVSKQGDEMTPTEMLSNLQMFSRERAENEGENFVDINQVNQIISPIDTDAIAEGLSAEGSDFDETELEDLLSEVSDGTLEAQQIQSVDDALNFPFTEANELLDDVNIVDEVMDDGMREYVRLWLLEVTDDIYQEMEERRKQV